MPRAREMLGGIVLMLVFVLCQYSAFAQWQQINEDGFGTDCQTTMEFVEFNGFLYAATKNPGRLLRLGDLSEESWFYWTELDLPASEFIADALTESETTSVTAMVVFTPSAGGFPWLYVAVRWGSESFVLRTQNTRDWYLASDIWEYSSHGEAVELAVFDGYLYVSIADTYQGNVEKMRLHRTANGHDWETIPPAELDLGPGDHWIEDLEVYDGYLYAGASGHNESSPGDHIAEVWRSRNGMNWSRIGELSSTTVSEVESMEVFGEYLYVGTKNHYGILEETSVPELWRYDGRDWEKIETAGQFQQNALHVVSLTGHNGVLYAGLGGGPVEGRAYGRLYRSVDGETWEQITPADIVNNPETSYLIESVLGIGEYIYIATGDGEAGTGGTQVWRMATMRSDVGPCLAQHDGEPHLLYREPSPGEQRIFEAVIRDEQLLALGPVHDEDVSRSWAFTSKQPVAYGYNFMGMMVGSRYLQLVYRGHNNDSIWHTRKTSDGRNWSWQTPEIVEGAHTDSAPGATAHDWAGLSGPQLTIAYTEVDTGRIHYCVKVGDEWNPQYAMPEEARSSNGPEVISFDESLYVFFRGYGDDDWIYVARKLSNLPLSTRWDISRLSRAFTRRSETDRAVSAVVYDGALVVAYVGHNNDYISLRRSTDGVNWDRLGYVRGPNTDHNPDLTVVGGTLYLAFKPTGDEEICLGTLELDTENEHDTPGHVWRSVRPMDCCSGCFLTILEFIMPVESGGGK